MWLQWQQKRRGLLSGEAGDNAQAPPGVVACAIVCGGGGGAILIPLRSHLGPAQLAAAASSSSALEFCGAGEALFWCLPMCRTVLQLQ
jgi:hypothetical protein